jgi:hemerythrin
LIWRKEPAARREAAGATLAQVLDTPRRPGQGPPRRRTSTHNEEAVVALMNWCDSLSVGLPQIDHDHMKLIEMVNRLYEAIQAGQGQATCGPILGDLVDYTRTHFATEERLMALHGYEHAAEHRAQHEKLVAQVRDFQRRFDAGSAMLTVAMLQFLMDWLSNHILRSDRALAQALTEKA